jgi:hypothetical protein
MATTTPVGQESSISYGAYPFTYANGLQISLDATTPLTQLDISAGVTIDSTDTFQMINPSTIVINCLAKGLNGLDTGTLAAATVYSVYLISDPVSLQPIGGMLSLAGPLSAVGPLMPFSYSAYRLIGYVTTAAGAATFLPGYWTAGSSGFRLFMYDAPLATAVTAGTSTSYANVNLYSAVPNMNNVPVLVNSVFTPTAAGSALNLQPGNATGAARTVLGQVAAVVVNSVSTVLAQTVTISTIPSPVVNYKVVGSVAVNVEGYYWAI